MKEGRRVATHLATPVTTRFAMLFGPDFPIFNLWPFLHPCSQMTKFDLIEKLIVLAGGDGRQVTEAVELVFKTMKQTLCKDDRIEIRGFGSFQNRVYGSYQGRNPKTGSYVTVPAKRVPFFKVASDLRKSVNRGSSQPKIKSPFV